MSFAEFLSKSLYYRRVYGFFVVKSPFNYFGTGEAKMKLLMGTLVVALVCVVVLVAVHPPDSDNATPKKRDFTDREVAVFSDEDFFEKAKDILGGSTSKVESFLSKPLGGMEIVMIDVTWLTAGGEGGPSKEQIKSMLDANMPLIFVNDSSYFYEKCDFKIEVDVSDDSSLTYCVYRDLDGKTNLSVCSGSELSDALIAAYNKADRATTPVLANPEGAVEYL